MSYWDFTRASLGTNKITILFKIMSLYVADGHQSFYGIKWGDPGGGFVTSISLV